MLVEIKPLPLPPVDGYLVSQRVQRRHSLNLVFLLSTFMALRVLVYSPFTNKDADMLSCENALAGIMPGHGSTDVYACV